MPVARCDEMVTYLRDTAAVRVGTSAPVSARVGADDAAILGEALGFTIAALRAKKYSSQPDYVRMAETHWYTGLSKAGIPEK